MHTDIVPGNFYVISKEFGDANADRYGRSLMLGLDPNNRTHNSYSLNPSYRSDMDGILVFIKDIYMPKGKVRTCLDAFIFTRSPHYNATLVDSILDPTPIPIKDLESVLFWNNVNNIPTLTHREIMYLYRCWKNDVRPDWDRERGMKNEGASVSPQ